MGISPIFRGQGVHKEPILFPTLFKIYWKEKISICGYLDHSHIQV